MATKKKSPRKAKGRTTTKSPAKKRAKKASKKKAPKKATKNKLGVKNSLVNNINAKKKKGTSKPKKKSTVSGKAYKDMQNNWGKSK